MLNVVEHPVIKELITKLRDQSTGTELYRMYTRQITTYLVYEALRDVELKGKEVTTQTGSVYLGDEYSEEIAFVSILRAGLSMMIEPLNNYPNAEFHAVGLKRNEEDPYGTEPEFYLDRLHEISPRTNRVVIVDPMFATGGTILTLLKSLFEKHSFRGRVDIVCLISAKEGVEKLESLYPDVNVTCAGYDAELNESAYIVPGLGDAGDRFFGVNQK